MLRQRIRTRSSPVSFVGRLVLVVFLLAVLWYGLMAVLLALGLSPGRVDLISGYRTAYDYLSGLTGDDLSPRVRLIVGLSGLLGFFVFAYLAYKEIPRPYVARRTLDLAVGDQHGATEVSPRAIERVAESAAFGNAAVSAAAGRWEGKDLNVDVHLERADDLPDTLRDVQHRVGEALGAHELPPVPVVVTLTGFQRQPTRREIS